MAENLDIQVKWHDLQGEWLTAKQPFKAGQKVLKHKSRFIDRRPLMVEGPRLVLLATFHIQHLISYSLVRSDNSTKQALAS